MHLVHCMVAVVVALPFGIADDVELLYPGSEGDLVAIGASVYDASLHAVRAA